MVDSVAEHGMATDPGLDARFELTISGQGAFTDAEITALLQEVYVDAGFTTAADAKTSFDPAAVRATVDSLKFINYCWGCKTSHSRR